MNIFTAKGWLVFALFMGILGLIFFIFLTQFKKSEDDNVFVYEDTNTVDESKSDSNVLAFEGDFCFGRVQIATEEEPYGAEESISINIADQVVLGEKKGFQEGPDMTNGYEGNLRGFISDNDIEVVYSYVVEGSQGKELENYKIYHDRLEKNRFVLVQEGDMLVPDKESQPSIITYQRVECN